VQLEGIPMAGFFVSGWLVLAVGAHAEAAFLPAPFCRATD
jgi:hypothetical protein